MIEPAFYFGALYVSYAITVAVCIIPFIISKLLIGLPILTSYAIVFIALILFVLINLRLSRILWINMFVSYEE